MSYQNYNLSDSNKASKSNKPYSLKNSPNKNDIDNNDSENYNEQNIKVISNHNQLRSKNSK